MGWSYEPLPPDQSSDALRADIRRMEDALHPMPRDDAQRRDLLWCLAERYVDLEGAALRDGSNDAAASARASAIQYYRSVIADYPGAQGVDEVLFDLALEQQRSQDRASALATYRALLAGSPSSHYAPDAHFALAEAAAAQGAADPAKLKEALAEYGAVLESQTPDTVHGRAWYALGRIHLCAGDTEEARHDFRKAVDYTKTFPQLRQGRDPDAMVRDATRLEGADPTRARVGSCPYRPSE